MSGNEIIDNQELRELKNIFTKSKGVLFAHGFDLRRNNIFRTKIFEKNFRKYLKCKYAVSCSSGTAAGTIALMALGIGKGDEVIVQSFTFIAAIESILMTGAKPVIVDTDNTLGMCPKDLQKKITKKTKCIMPVHMLGGIANMSKILSIAKKKRIPIIEDACEALGAEYFGKQVGTMGLSGFFSLDFGKIITTGEGGIICTNDRKQYLNLKSLRDHGHINKPGIHRGLDKALRRGFNFRMTEMQGAVGLAQLKKINKILDLKRKNRKIIYDILNKNKSIKFRTIHDKSSKGDQNDHIIFFLKNPKIAKKVKKELDKKKISTGILPVAIRWHYAGYWKHIWKEDKKFRNYLKIDYWKNAWSLLQRSISIPVSILAKKEKLKADSHKISKIINNHNL